MTSRVDIHDAFLAADDWSGADYVDRAALARADAYVVDSRGRRYACLPGDPDAPDRLRFHLDERLHGTVAPHDTFRGHYATSASHHVGAHTYFNVPGPAARTVSDAVAALADACTYEVVCTDLHGRARPPFLVYGLPPHPHNRAEPGAIAFRLRRQLHAGLVRAPRAGRLEVRHAGMVVAALDLRATRS